MLAFVEIAAIVIIGLVYYYQNREEALVVYCAHDAVFSEKILKQFEQQTGIKVEPRFDTEATKSLGLTNLIIREKEHPRCDVFWNNQALGTAALKEQDLLAPYQGPALLNVLRYLDLPQTLAMAATRSPVVLTKAKPEDWKYPAEVSNKLGWDQSRLQIQK